MSIEWVSQEFVQAVKNPCTTSVALWIVRGNSVAPIMPSAMASSTCLCLWRSAMPFDLIILLLIHFIVTEGYALCSTLQAYLGNSQGILWPKSIPASLQDHFISTTPPISRVKVGWHTHTVFRVPPPKTQIMKVTTCVNMKRKIQHQTTHGLKEGGHAHWYLDKRKGRKGS